MRTLAEPAARASTSIASIFDPRRGIQQRRREVENLFDFLVAGGVADTRPMPSRVIARGLKRTVRRYEAVTAATHGTPVLLVPPLGSPSTCMDLRRGCSLAEHLVATGRPTYIVDYGPISFADRELGLEHWIAEVLPEAVRAVSADAGGAPVALVGWCLGGVLALLSTAGFPELPVSAIAMVASPFDMRASRFYEPLRIAGKLTAGLAITGGVRALGVVPPWIVGPSFKLSSLPTYVKKPVTLLRHRDDRDFLAHIEAVDSLMNNMYAYPGRVTLQSYHRLLDRNELASGTFAAADRTVALADVRARVMNIAGASDVLVPAEAVHHVGGLLPNAAEVRLETAPGGHLGVLTGRSAPTTTWALIDNFLDTNPTT